MTSVKDFDRTTLKGESEAMTSAPIGAGGSASTHESDVATAAPAAGAAASTRESEAPTVAPTAGGPASTPESEPATVAPAADGYASGARESMPLARLLGGVACAYAVTTVLGLALVLGPLEQSVFYPSTGLLLGVLVMSLRARWPALVVIAAATEMVTTTIFDLISGRSTSFGWLLYFAVATVGVSLVAAILTRGVIGSERWSARRIMVAIALAGLVSAGGAMAGVVGLTAVAGGPVVALAAQLWWTSDMLGIVAMGPLVVTAWLRWKRGDSGEQEASTAELAALLAVAALAMFLVFGNPPEAGLWRSPFILVPVLFWAAVRFPPVIVAALNLALALVASAFTKYGLGPFRVPGPPSPVSAVPLQFFLIVVLTSTFVMSVAIEGRRIALAQYARADRRLRLAVRRITDADERARRQAAEDLHDSIGQSTVAARLMLENALRGSLPEPVRSTATQVSQILQSAQEEIRALIRSLAPPPVARLGLEAALSGLVSEFRREHGVEASLSIEGAVDRIPYSLSALIYRWVRELLLNVSKHARARTAMVRVTLVGAEVVVQVQDDGVGFDAERVLAEGAHIASFGLESIVDRATALGGSAGVDSRPGQGCRVTITVPVVAEGAEVEQSRDGLH